MIIIISKGCQIIKSAQSPGPPSRAAGINHINLIFLWYQIIIIIMIIIKIIISKCCQIIKSAQRPGPPSRAAGVIDDNYLMIRMRFYHQSVIKLSRARKEWGLPPGLLCIPTYQHMKYILN